MRGKQQYYTSVFSVLVEWVQNYKTRWELHGSRQFITKNIDPFEGICLVCDMERASARV